MAGPGKDKVERLMQQGVTVYGRETVFIGEEVPLDRIAGQGVILYPGCRISGKKTLIMPHAVLGREGPVSVEDCQVGPGVELRGGFFRQSVFLEGVRLGYGAQVREGCLLEEESSGAHSVGLKQTILFPFVTLGSLVNFCDCLMAGGTSRKNHSEVGSSYIHFNFTANQDKATPSLIGDVPRGVMLNQPPIFLGGQGGMVGPLKVEYGTVVAAGTICRKDVLDKEKLVLPQSAGEATHHMPNTYPGMYGHVERRVTRNLDYIANLTALRRWYIEVRSVFFKEHPMGKSLYQGALEKLEMAIHERMRRLRALAQKMSESAEKYRAVMNNKADERVLRQKQELFDRWQTLEEVLGATMEVRGDLSVLEPFVKETIKQAKEKGFDYVATIQGLDRKWSARGTEWLQWIVDEVNGQALKVIPSYGHK
jgi:UDP-N-acetylglucosamine/UDP-N-acetylgalactosamine diphosphorylase